LVYILSGGSYKGACARAGVLPANRRCTGDDAMTRKILVADVPELDARLVQLLPGHHLYFVRTLEEAQRALRRDDFDLLIVSVHFDDSRMFDLLRFARQEGRNKAIPIVCLREAGLGFTAISAQTLEVTCRALEANVFIDLADFADDAARDTALRAAVDALLKGG
jgi:CheY-like chemotaxis protein